MNDLLFVHFLFYGIADCQNEAVGEGEPCLRHYFKAVHNRPVHVKTLKTGYIHFIIHTIFPVLWYYCCRYGFAVIAYPGCKVLFH